MNKRKRMAWLKHRRKEKKLKERKKTLKARIEAAEEILKRDELSADLRSKLQERLAAARSALSAEGENFRKKLSELRMRAQELEQLLTGLK